MTPTLAGVSGRNLLQLENVCRKAGRSVTRNPKTAEEIASDLLDFYSDIPYSEPEVFDMAQELLRQRQIPHKGVLTKFFG